MSNQPDVKIGDKEGTDARCIDFPFLFCYPGNLAECAGCEKFNKRSTTEGEFKMEEEYELQYDDGDLDSQEK